MKSLISFSTNSGSDEEVKFEEMKAIYDCLEDAIHLCAGQPSYQVAMSLDGEISWTIEELLRTSGRYQQDGGELRDAEPKLLLPQVIYSIRGSRRHYRDNLRRKGLSLRQVVYDKGEFSGKRNILLNDHTSVHESFVD